MITERYGTLRQTEIIQQCLTPMQERIRTEGAHAIVHGETWSGECGGLFVTLTPQGTDPPPVATAGTASP